MFATLLKKETLAQVLSYEFCETFKNTFFYRIPLVAPSVLTSNCSVSITMPNKSFFFVYAFRGEIYSKLKNIYLVKPPLIYKKKLFE